MDKIVVESGEYEFRASNKQVIIGEKYLKDFKEETILSVINKTDNIIIYSVGCEGFGGTIFGDCLKLEYDTTSMSSDDTLQIILSKNDISTELLKTIKDNTACLNEVVGLLQVQNELLKQMY